jgi:hypothetical protein
MTSKVALVIILTVSGWICNAQVEQPKFSVGLEVKGETLLHLTYMAHPLENSEDINKLLKGQLPKQDLDEFNLGTKFSKVATLETKKALTLGQIELAAGKYPAGFNADEKGNLFFVVWVDGKAKKTQLKVEDLKSEKVPFLSFLCGPFDKGSALVALYGTHYSMIPVKKIGTSKAGASTEGASEDEDWKKATDNLKDGFSGR